MRILSIRVLTVAALLAMPMSAWAQAPASSPTPVVAASDAIKQAFPKALIKHNLDGSPGLIVGLDVDVQGKDLATKSQNFLTTWSKALGLEHVSLSVIGTPQRMGNTRVVRMSQMHGTMAVLDRMATVTFNAKGHIIAWHANTVSVHQTVKGPVTQTEAITYAARALYGTKAPKQVKGARILARVLSADGTTAVEAWLVQMPRTAKLLAPRVLVRTTDGQILSIRDAAKR